MAIYGILAFLPKSHIRNQIRFFRFYPILDFSDSTALVKIKLKIADASANMWKRMIHILPQLPTAWIQVSHTVVDLQLAYLWNEFQFYSTWFIAKKGKGWNPLKRVDMDGHKNLNKKRVKIVKAPEKFKVLTRSQEGHQKAPEDWPPGGFLTRIWGFESMRGLLGVSSFTIGLVSLTFSWKWQHFELMQIEVARISFESKQTIFVKLKEVGS